jgi:integrase
MSNPAAARPDDPPGPPIVNRKVPVRRKNADYRSREYLSETEVAAVGAAAAAQGRHGLRDSTLILVAFRHGLRVSELVALRWDQVDLAHGLLHVNRAKNGMPSVHPLRGPELRALRRVRRVYPETPYVFVSERKAPLTPSARSSPGPVRPPASGFPSTRTCCAMRPATSWPTTDGIPARSSITSVTGTSSTPPATLSWLRTGSKISGWIEPLGVHSWVQGTLPY